MSPSQFFDLVRVGCDVLRARILFYNRQPEVEAIQATPIKHSPHEVWLAADVDYLNRLPVAERVEWWRRLGIRDIVEADHDHLQPLEWEAG